MPYGDGVTRSRHRYIASTARNCLFDNTLGTRRVVVSGFLAATTAVGGVGTSATARAGTETPCGDRTLSGRLSFTTSGDACAQFKSSINN